MFDRSRKNVSVLQSCSEILLDLKQGMAGADWESSEMTSRKKCGTKKGWPRIKLSVWKELYTQHLIGLVALLAEDVKVWSVPKNLKFALNLRKLVCFQGKYIDFTCSHSFPGIYAKPSCFVVVVYLASEILCVCQQQWSQKHHQHTGRAYKHIRDMYKNETSSPFYWARRSSCT